MEYKKLIREKHAVAGVIEALLLVALVAIVISTIQLVYIPQIMEQREAEHMDEASNQFSHLKSMIDIQFITKSDVPIFSMITLGSRELPYFITARASGELSIITNEAYRIEIDYIPTPIAYLTSVKYDAYNSYFVDQTYALEGGGIIVKQPEGESVMRADPAVSVVNGTDVTIYLDLPKFVDIPGKNSTSGYGKCFVRTNYSSDSSQTYPDVSSIKIYTNYPNAWNESLNKSLGNIVGYAVDLIKGTDYVEIKKVMPEVKPINLEITEIQIYAQISPGWII